MKMISNSLIEDTLHDYGVALVPGMTDKISSYISLLLKWNEKISLTTVTTPAEILKFHFGESIFAASVLDFEKSRLADVGTGAGFPGLPLAIAVPSLVVVLIESIGKKCSFLSEVVRTLQLENVIIFRGRMEDFPADSEPHNFVAARALGRLAKLLAWTKGRIAADGKVVLWLGEADSREISMNRGWRWEAPRPITGSERRYLLVGSPNR
jgi:16S rRNA (guanine527-N7)-methyltransferase